MQVHFNIFKKATNLKKVNLNQSPPWANHFEEVIMYFQAY